MINMTRSPEDEKWHEIARDYGAPLFKNYIFTRGFRGYPGMKQMFGFTLPLQHFGMESKKNEIVYVYKASLWKQAHELFTAMLEKDIKLLRKIVDKTDKYGLKATKESEDLFNSNLKSKSNEWLLEKLHYLSLKQSSLYTYGSLVPLLDFAHNLFIEGNLKNYLDSKLDRKKAEEYFHVLTVPTNDSFALIQEK